GHPHGGSAALAGTPADDSRRSSGKLRAAIPSAPVRAAPAAPGWFAQEGTLTTRGGPGRAAEIHAGRDTKHESYLRVDSVRLSPGCQNLPARAWRSHPQCRTGLRPEDSRVCRRAKTGPATRGRPGLRPEEDRTCDRRKGWVSDGRHSG